MFQPLGGPRHLAWGSRKSSDQLDAYVICSLTRQLLSFEVDMTQDFNFNPQGTPLSTEPTQAHNQTSLEGSEVLISPDGRFVVTSTTQTSRKAADVDDNLLVSFPRDTLTGLLTDQPTLIRAGGRVPRQFAFDPSGELMAVALQGADSVAVFERDLQTGSAVFLTQANVERASYATWRSLS